MKIYKTKVPKIAMEIVSSLGSSGDVEILPEKVGELETKDATRWRVKWYSAIAWLSELSAGRLIDRAGLKGARIGDAQVSSQHANFIVNLGGASCDDVLSLMEHIQRRVLQRFDICLEPEIRVLGERWGKSP
jgi:UDP-N-acetylenolpyruvoylglucosamine reductase